MKDTDALLAVLAGGINRPFKVLRSSLYFIPSKDIGGASASLAGGPLSGEDVYYDISPTTANIEFSFKSVRVDYSEEDNADAAMDFNIAMTYSGIAYPVYEETDDSANAFTDFNLAMTYTEITFPVYEETDDSANAVTDFNIAMTIS